MAELSLEDVMAQLKILNSEVKKLATEFGEVTITATEAKDMAQENKEALYGDEKSTNLEEKGIIGAVIAGRIENKRYAGYLALLITVITTAGTIAVAIIVAGGLP